MPIDWREECPAQWIGKVCAGLTVSNGILVAECLVETVVEDIQDSGSQGRVDGLGPRWGPEPWPRKTLECLAISRAGNVR